jgi:hypothetical protein
VVPDISEPAATVEVLLANRVKKRKVQTKKQTWRFSFLALSYLARLVGDIFETASWTHPVGGLE